MSTKTEIFNMAISHLAIGIPIAAWDTDLSVEAEALRRFYPTVRDQLIREIDWPFAVKYADLSLVEEDPVVDTWEYSYAYPADCLRFLKICSGTRVDTLDSRIPYERVGQYIYTDESTATCKYVYRVQDESAFPPDFVYLLSLRLAISIAPRVLSGDNTALLKRLYEQYGYELGLAKQNAFNEGGHDYEVESEYTRVRQ